MSLDPLEALRLAWKQESTSPIDEDISSADLDTQAKVRALQVIWQQQAVEFDVNLNQIRRRYRRGQESSSFFKLTPLGAIAALACAAGLLTWIARPKDVLNSSDELNSTTVSFADAEPLVPELSSTPNQPALSSVHGSSFRMVPEEAISYRKDGIELVSGSVRLVLVQPSTSRTQ